MTDLSKLQGDAEKFLGKREQFPDHQLDELCKLIRMLTKGESLHLGRIIVEAMEQSGTDAEKLSEALRELPNEELLERIQKFAEHTHASRLKQADALLRNLSRAGEE